MGISWQIILCFALGLTALYFIGYALLSPAKILMKFILSSLIGAAAVVIINLICGAAGFSFPVNPLTAVVVGCFGLPGVLLILVLKLILHF